MLRRQGSSAFIDRALYLPKQWTEDRPRCLAAGICWYRHITLSLLAHAVLAVLQLQEKKTPEGRVELSNLLSKLMKKAEETVEQILYWPDWRRRHQYKARQYHYHRREGSLITEKLRL